jgi:hypothetical protein
VAAVLSTRINKPLTWWRKHLGVNKRGVLVKLWPWSLIAFLIIVSSATIAAISGWPLLLFFDATTTSFFAILNALGFISDVFLLFAILSGIAYDIQRNPETLHWLEYGRGEAEAIVDRIAEKRESNASFLIKYIFCRNVPLSFITSANASNFSNIFSAVW